MELNATDRIKRGLMVWEHNMGWEHWQLMIIFTLNKGMKKTQLIILSMRPALVK